MKKFAGKTLALVLIAVFSITVFAADKPAAKDKAVTKEVSFIAPTLVGGKLLPAGTYKVTVGADNLSFLQSGVKKEKAAEASVTVNPEKVEKARGTTLGIGNNDQKQPVLLSVTFRGQETRYVVK